MKKLQLEKMLKSRGITYEIFWSQKDKNSSCYALKLIKDKNTSLRTNVEFNYTEKDVENMINRFEKFDYREYMKSILHN
jgi:hypothetical protein